MAPGFQQMLQEAQKSLLCAANARVAAHGVASAVTRATGARDPLVPKDGAQEHVNIITQRHPQLVPFGEAAGEPRVSMETPWSSSEGASSRLFRFRARTERPSEKRSCVLINFLSAAAGQPATRPEGWESIFALPGAHPGWKQRRFSPTATCFAALCFFMGSYSL